ncbi:MAG TPA: DUF192 domain-containing protein [Polyangiaceae bacterium]|nr:DUF192 domain-containing protein [Polyangiaceae bacterium]
MLALLFATWAAASCDPAGPRHDPADKTSLPSAPTGAIARDSSAPAASGSSHTTVSGNQRCVTPRAEPPPAVAEPAARCPADPDGPLALPQGAVRFVDAPSAPRVSVERALDDAARARGLMYRTRLDADAGMLFSWDSESPRSFWMRNTCVPLDMLFIAADGTIVGILEQVPTLNTLPRAVPCPAQHVLEVNAGWTRQHGVAPGQKVEFET